MRFFVAARERVIELIFEEVRKKENHLAECNEAIGDLTLEIAQGRRKLKAHVRRG
jgi:hypothetical protein